MVWCPSVDTEATVSRRDSDVESSSHAPEDTSRFVAQEDTTAYVAREDTTAYMARELDLPEDPKPSLLMRKGRTLAVGEGGTSNWHDAPEPPLFTEVML